jgi:hypothetical protein
MTATADDLLSAGAVTIQGATREFGIGRSTLYELMNAGKLSYSTATGRRLIPRNAIKQLLADGMVGADASDEASGRVA